MDDQPHALHRAELLVGAEALARLARVRVILFGVGGVGSWAAEALVRSGVTQLTLVDGDRVSPSNINRQLQATPRTVGQVKVAVLADRLREINPAATVEAVHRAWVRETREEFDLARYDYVLDAIDSLNNKVELIRAAHAAGAKVMSALGAACKLDPTRIQTGSLWDSERCRLARLVRKRLRRRGFDGEVQCVFSGEPVSDASREDGDVEAGETPRIHGSLVHVTAAFGMALAGLLIQDVLATGDPVAKPPETD